jgi:hypothetical protein
MEPMHQPILIKEVHHSLTCDGSEVEITKFYEYITNVWYKDNLTLFNFKNTKWDNGNDILRFDTTSGKVNIVKHIQKLSETFPTMFFMYDYYTADSVTDFEEGVYWVFEGSANTSKQELFKEE